MGQVVIWQLRYPCYALLPDAGAGVEQQPAATLCECPEGLLVLAMSTKRPSRADLRHMHWHTFIDSAVCQSIHQHDGQRVRYEEPDRGPQNWPQRSPAARD